MIDRPISRLDEYRARRRSFDSEFVFDAYQECGSTITTDTIEPIKPADLAGFRRVTRPTFLRRALCDDVLALLGMLAVLIAVVAVTIYYWP